MDAVDKRYPDSWVCLMNPDSTQDRYTKHAAIFKFVNQICIACQFSVSLWDICVPLCFQVWCPWAETEYSMWCSQERKSVIWRQTERTGRENQTATGEIRGFAGSPFNYIYLIFSQYICLWLINYTPLYQKTSTVKSASDIKKLPLEVSMKPTESSAQVLFLLSYNLFITVSVVDTCLIHS